MFVIVVNDAIEVGTSIRVEVIVSPAELVEVMTESELDGLGSWPDEGDGMPTVAEGTTPTKVEAIVSPAEFVVVMTEGELGGLDGWPDGGEGRPAVAEGMTPANVEATVSPSELVVVTTEGELEGLGSTPDEGSPTTVEISVSPASLVVVTTEGVLDELGGCPDPGDDDRPAVAEGTKVIIDPLGKVWVAVAGAPLDRVVTPELPDMIVCPKEFVVVISPGIIDDDETALG